MMKDQETLVLRLSIPGYTVKRKVDYTSIGKRLDKMVQDNFLGRKILVRCVGSKDHVGINIEQLVDTIRRIGTDRYDPNRKMIFHDFYSRHNPDLFASPFTVTTTTPRCGEIIKEFYEKTTGDRKIGVKADIILIYDPKK